MHLKKISTGITGLDEILGGGFVLGKSTLIKGGTGTGKTTICLLYIYNSLKNNIPVTLLTCDESPKEIWELMESFDFFNDNKINKNYLSILDMRPNLTDTVAGKYSIDMLFKRIVNSLDEKKSTSLVIDSLQNLLLGLGLEESKKDIFSIIDFLRENEVTALISILDSSPVSNSTSFYEEFASDCVINLCQQFQARFMTRNLQVVKYRGSSHGTSNYPFAITSGGVYLLPLTTSMAKQPKHQKKLSTGLPKLDEMIGGEGYQANSTMMITGGSGSGKTLLTATMARAAIQQKKKVLYISFEEQHHDLINNVKSAGIDLSTALKNKQIIVDSRYAQEMELEQHLISIYQMVLRKNINVVVIDSITAMLDISNIRDIKLILVRFIAYLKENGVTILFTHLLTHLPSKKDIAVSSLVDHWVNLNLLEDGGRLRRTVYIRKSRGNAHSNHIHECFISQKGIRLSPLLQVDGQPVYEDEKRAWMEEQKTELTCQKLELQQVQSEQEMLHKQQSSYNSMKDYEFELQKQCLAIKEKKLERVYSKLLGYLKECKQQGDIDD